MIDSSLLWGMILIGVGLALAMIAYAVMLNRREPEGERTFPPAEPEPEVDEEPSEIQAPVQVAPMQVPATPPAPAPVPASPPPTPAAPAPAAPAPAAPAVVSSPASPAPAGRRLLPVASLLREDVTGALVIQVGERVYRRADELKMSSDWARVESASADLARWTAGGHPSGRPSAGAREETPRKPGSMIEQINEILERKLTSAGNAPRGVRLAEGPGGTVRVFVGLQAYNMEEVPDPAVRQLIRQAVAEWEASR